MDTTSDPTHNMQNPSTMFPYMGTSLIRKCPPLGPYRRPMPMVLGGSKGGGRFLMSEVPLYLPTDTLPPPPSSLPNASSRLTHSSHPPQTSDLPLHPPPLQTHSLHPPTPILRMRVWGSGPRGGPVQRRISPGPRKVDIRLPGKGNSNSHGARPVHLIITMIKWIRTSRLSIKNSLSPGLLACLTHLLNLAPPPPLHDALALLFLDGV